MPSGRRGPKPIPARRLMARKLAKAICAAVGEEALRARAEMLGERIGAEQGGTRAVATILDLRRATEVSVAEISAIGNANIVLYTPETAGLIQKLNIGNVNAPIEVPADVEVKPIIGKAEIAEFFLFCCRPERLAFFPRRPRRSRRFTRTLPARSFPERVAYNWLR